MLAGRRLFLGDTDFATVKQVQQAQIPPLSQINKQVTKDLERILAVPSLAIPRRATDRRGISRAISPSSSTSSVKPVSAFDIAELVRGAMAQRKKAAPDKASIIDKLIEEALFEFTSLQDDKAGAVHRRTNRSSSRGSSSSTTSPSLSPTISPSGTSARAPWLRLRRSSATSLRSKTAKRLRRWAIRQTCSSPSRRPHLSLRLARFLFHRALRWQRSLRRLLPRLRFGRGRRAAR